MNLHLSIVDQSLIISGHTAARASEETVKLAQAAETLAYLRYWLAEHHAVAALADPCPEILLTRLAGATRRIRVGTGGVLLRYYSARAVIGDPRQVRERLLQLRGQFNADELMILAITGDYASRPRSYELLAGQSELA